MGRSVRPWGLALVASLLLHVMLLGGVDWKLPHWAGPAEQLAFDVQLVSAPVPAAVSPPVARQPAPRLPGRPLTFPPPEPPIEPAAEAAAPAAMAVAGLIDAPAAGIEETPAVQAISAEPAPPPLNPLPRRLDLRFQVRYGLASGEQTLVWVNDGDVYTLTSVAGATGLTGVFYNGRFVQTSRGRITPRGLQPEEFWDQRGNKRSSARFDAASGTLTLNPAQGAPRHFAYQGNVQDALSLFFQFALTAPSPDGRLTYTVFNGKKLREYSYEVRGEAMLETALGPFRTLHLARVADRDGRLEAWLAVDRYYLPVRVLRSDDKGNQMELLVQSIVP